MSAGDAPVSMIDETAIVVQHDWFQCVGSAPHKFFIGVRYPSKEKTVFYDAIVDEKTGSIEVEKAENDVTAQMTGRSLRVRLATGECTNFVAPLVEYSGIHRLPIYTVSVSQTGSMLLTSDSDGHLRVSSTADGRLLRELEGHVMSLSAAHLLPSGLVALTGGIDMTLRIYSVETAETARAFKGHKMAITDAAIIDVGKDVVSCSKDGTAKKWNCGRGECDLTWTPEAGECTSIALSSDFGKIAIGCELNRVVVYPIDDKEPICTIITYSAVTSVAFSPSCEHIACGEESGAVEVFDATDGSRVFALRTRRGRVEKLRWRFDGIFVAYHDGTVCVYDYRERNAFPKLELSGGDCDPIYDLTFHEDTVYTACRDKTVRKYRMLQ